MSQLGFMDREMRYAKHWLASMGIYNYEEPHDPWWSELHNFLLSVRDGKPIIAPVRPRHGRRPGRHLRESLGGDGAESLLARGGAAEGNVEREPDGVNQVPGARCQESGARDWGLGTEV